MSITKKVTASVAAAATGLVVALSPSGLDAVKGHEGYRTQAYPDALHGWKVPTICYGSTKNVKRGDKATPEECNARLLADVQTHCGIVYDALVNTDVRLTQGEQDAYCSFAYNTGYFKTNRAGNQTSMYKNLIKGDHIQACKSINLYVAGADKAPGLRARRQAETELCLRDLSNPSS